MIYKESKIYDEILPLNLGFTKPETSASVMSRTGISLYYKLAVYAKASSGNEFILNAGIDYGYIITPNTYAIYSDNAAFSDFKDGDKVFIQSTSQGIVSQSVSVISVNPDGTIIVIDKTSFISPPLTSLNESNDDLRISLDLSTFDLKFTQNIIGQNEANTQNKFQNTVPNVFEKNGINSASSFDEVLSNVAGNNANKIDGGFHCQKISAGLNGETIFQIEFLITNAEDLVSPIAGFTYSDSFYREGEIENIDTLEMPNRFLNDNQRLTTKISLRGLNGSQFRDIEFYDNYNFTTPWFNKQQDGITDTELKITNLIYRKENSTGEIVEGIYSNKPTYVEYILESQNAIVAAGDLNFFWLKHNFCLLPTKSEYSVNTRTMKENFVFDELVTDGEATLPTATANGELFGGNFQAITNLVITEINAFKIKVTLIINLGATAQALALAYTNQRCLLSVNTYVHEETCLVIDVPQTLYEVKLDTPIITFEDWTVLRHSETEFSTIVEDEIQINGTQNVEASKEEENILFKLIRFNSEDYPSNAKLSKIEQRIICKNKITGENFTLENFVYDCLNSPIYSGSSANMQILSYLQTRGFQVQDNSLKQIRVNSDTAQFISDSEEFFDVKLYYPFIIRWEYFLSKIGVSMAFYDNTKPNDGQSEDWYRYSTALADWEIFERTIITLQYLDPQINSNVPVVYTDEHQMNVHDYASNPAYTKKEIKTYDLDNNLVTEISNEKDTLVKAFFDTGVAKDLEKTVVYFHAETPEGQGVQETKTFSSFFAKMVDTIFKSIDASNKVVMVNVGTELQASVLIDYKKIQNYDELKLVAIILDIYPRLEIIDIDVETATTTTVTFNVSTALARYYTVNDGASIDITGTSFNENFVATINENIKIYHNGIENYSTSDVLKYTRLDLTRTSSLKSFIAAGIVDCEFLFPPFAKNIIEHLELNQFNHTEIIVPSTEYLNTLIVKRMFDGMDFYFEDLEYPEVEYIDIYYLATATIHNFIAANFPKLQTLLLTANTNITYDNEDFDFTTCVELIRVALQDSTAKNILGLDKSPNLSIVNILEVANDFDFDNSQNLSQIEWGTTTGNTKNSIFLGNTANLTLVRLVNFNSISSLNLSGYGVLEEVQLDTFNSLTTLTLPATLEKLYLINFGANPYVFANYSGLTSLKVLSMLNTTNISTFNTPPNLEFIRFDSNSFSSGIDVSSSVTTMKWVYINTNDAAGLSTIVYSDTECFYLDRNDVDVTSLIDLSDFTNLNLFYQKNTSLINLDVSSTIGFSSTVSSLKIRPTIGSQLNVDPNKVAEIVVSLAANVTNEPAFTSSADFYNITVPTLGLIDLQGNCASPNILYPGYGLAVTHLTGLGFTISTN